MVRPLAQRGVGGGNLGLHGLSHDRKNLEFTHLPEAQRELRRTLAFHLVAQGGGLRGGQAVEQSKEWKREFAAGEIRAEGFADARFVTEEIHQVVVDLVGDAEVPTEAA